MPSDMSAQLLALQQQLAQSEWWPPEELSRQQFRQLAHLVSHAYDALPFYRARLTALDYRRGQEITREFWTKMPVLSRLDVQQHGLTVASTEALAGHGQLGSGTTSGSTGTPLKYVKTELAELFWLTITLRNQIWQQNDFRLKFASIRRDHDNLAFPPAGRTHPDWAIPANVVFPTGPACMLDNRSTPQEQAQWLMREEPDYLLSFPSVIQEVARYFHERGLRLKRLKRIATLGEVVTPRLRVACRETFGVEIADMYSAAEIGYIALQCPVNEHYHVQSETVLLEVLDEAGLPCRAGEIGAVVVTPLQNFAMPLLRYSLGDFAEVGGPCSCGRRLPVLNEILGRARDTVMLPSGTRRYAWIGMKPLHDIPEIVQFQVIQRSLYELEAKLVTRGPLGPDTEERIRQTLRGSLGEHFSVVVSYHDSIPRAASGKYFDFISEVPG